MSACGTRLRRRNSTRSMLKILRDDVEQAFAEEIGLEAARPAIGADRRLVGELQRDVDVDILDPVGAGHELRDVARADRAVGAHIGADVDIGVAAQPQDGAVARAGDLDIAFRLARVVHAHQVLAAVLGPFHRPAGHAAPRTGSGNPPDRTRRARRSRRRRRSRRARPGLPARPSCFARVRRLKNSTLAAPETVSRPRAASHSASRPRGSIGERHVPLGSEALAPRIGRSLERRGGIAAHGVELDRQIGARLLEQQRLVPRRHVPVGNRRQRLDLDLDQADRILGNGRALRQHQRDRLAHIAHLSFRRSPAARTARNPAAAAAASARAAPGCRYPWR